MTEKMLGFRLRVVRYHESWQESGKKAERWMWLVTTLEQTAQEILWEMMNRRWDFVRVGVKKKNNREQNVGETNFL